MGRDRPRVITCIAVFFVNEGTPVENHAFGRRRIFPAFLPYYFLGTMYRSICLLPLSTPHPERIG